MTMGVSGVVDDGFVERLMAVGWEGLMAIGVSGVDDDASWGRLRGVGWNGYE